MREIKFNAVDEETSEYITYNNWLIESHESGETENEYLSAFLEFYYGFRLLQYTGLKDKNGVEIYESDLLKIRLNNEETVVVTVVFDRGSFNVACSNGNGYTVAYIKHEAEVIGNIYENEELLK